MNNLRTYGVTRNIRSEIKLQGAVTLNDAAVYVIFVLLAMMGGKVFPPTQSNLKIIFYVVMGVFAIWLTMKPVSNPGKRNYQIMLFMLKRRPSAFRSLNPFQDPQYVTRLQGQNPGRVHKVQDKRRGGQKIWG